MGKNPTDSIGIAGSGAKIMPRHVRASIDAIPSLASPMSAPGPSADPAPPPRNATWLEVVPVVLSSFLGIRKGKAMRRDAVSIRPVQVIVVGLLGAAVLVTCLVLLVRLILRSAGA